jgi:putative ubiquitin-RnfH superfamily antitoxin RatB of RatAB toxin-antitoxin module
MASLEIEVVLALPGAAACRAYSFPPPATVADALARAAADPTFPPFDPHTAAVGIFGRISPREQPLAPGDRVEIYRPLVCDPKAQRRARAAAPRPSRSAPP